jgi:sulfur carrier protein
MKVLVNGEVREFPDALTIAELVAEEAPELAGGRGVAVAVDAEVVPRGAWAETRLEDGQRVELLAAMQGGARE